MTIDGALNDLNNLLKADDIPIYYKPSIKAVMETITMEIKPMPQEQCGDCISREAVMHILDEVGGDFDSPREAVVPIDYIADMVSELPSVTAQPCGDAVSRQAVLEAIDVKAWEFCDYLIRNGRNDEQKPVSHFADNLRECVGDLPSVTPQPKMGHISIDNVMAVFDDFMRGDVDENNTETFLEMLKDKAEGSEE